MSLLHDLKLKASQYEVINPIWTRKGAENIRHIWQHTAPGVRRCLLRVLHAAQICPVDDVMPCYVVQKVIMPQSSCLLHQHTSILDGQLA